MNRCLVLCFWSLLSFAECNAENYILYGTIEKTHEVLPTVIYPPSGGEDMPRKSLLSTFSLAGELGNFEFKKRFLDDLHARVLEDNSSGEPFFGRGENYIIKTPDNKFYLVFYENDKRLDEKLRGKRFTLNLLKKIAIEEDLFVLSAKAGGVCRDEAMLKILKGLGGDSDNAHQKKTIVNDE